MPICKPSVWSMVTLQTASDTGNYTLPNEMKKKDKQYVSVFRRPMHAPYLTLSGRIKPDFYKVSMFLPEVK